MGNFAGRFGRVLLRARGRRALRKRRPGRSRAPSARGRRALLERLEERTFLSIGPVPAAAAAPGADLVATTLVKPGELLLQFSPQDFSVQQEADGTQQIVSSGLVGAGNGGSPELPGELVRLALPMDTDLGSVTLVPQSSQVTVVPGVANLAPAPTAETDGGGQADAGSPATALVNGKNPAVYGQNAYYGQPAATLVSTQQMGRWKIAEVYYSPFQYNPVTGSVRETQDATVALEYQGGDPLPAALAGDTAWDAQAAGMLANYAAADAAWYGTGAAAVSGTLRVPSANGTRSVPDTMAGPADAPAGSGVTTANYVIITTAAIQAGSDGLGGEDLAAFVAFKQSQGYTVAVETESAWGGGTGDTAANNIHNWLAANYASMGIQYVLLVGDPDPSTGDVPMKLTYPRISESNDPEGPVAYQAPTDYYYAALTSNWKDAGDAYYGGWGSGEAFTSVPLAEVSVGRIPVYDGSGANLNAAYATLNGILAKTITYESSLNTTWRKSILLPLGTSNYANESYSGEPRTDGSALGSYIQSNLATPGGYSTYTMYEEGGVSPVTPAGNAALTATNLVSQWSATPYGIVDWWGHGDVDAGTGTGTEVCSEVCTSTSGNPPVPTISYNWFFSSADAASLGNNYPNDPSIVVQVSCATGCPTSPTNIGYSLLEQGAVATVCASADTWYGPGSWQPSFGLAYGDNASYAYYITQQLQSTASAPFGATVGQALQWTQEHLGTGFGDASWMNVVAANLYGDPSLALFPPARIAGTVANDLNGNGVLEAGDPGLSGRTVFLDDNNNGQLYSGTSTLASGAVNVPIAYNNGSVSQTSTQTLSSVPGAVTSVTVTLNIAYGGSDWDEDLTVDLVSPEGTQVQLFSGVGGSGQNFTNTTLSDAGTTPIASGTAPFTGTFRPAQPLAALDGQNPNGIWQLQITDGYPGDTGTLDNWTVSIGTADPSTTTDANGNYAFNDLGAGTYHVRLVSQSGWVDTNPSTGEQDVTVAGGAIVSNVNFLAAQYVPPVAANYAWSTDENTLLSVPAAGVLLDDTDPQGWPLTAALVTGPAHGSIVLNPNGSFLYTPAAGYTGPDSFTYQANDGEGNSNTATVSITVNPLPVAANHGYVTDQGQAMSVAAPGVLLGATGDGPLTAVLASGPAHGTLALQSNGSFLYTPAAGYTGPDSFAYQANDGVANSNAATVSITVNPLPVATSHSYLTDQGVALSVAAPGVLLGDTGGSPLTAVLVTSPAHGTLTLQSGGSFLYTPAAGYSGPDSFSYEANDGVANSNAATVSITVNPLPVATDHGYATDQGLALSVAAPGVLSGATGGSPLTAVLVTGPVHGTLALESGGSFLYTPAAGYTGTDSFTYQANDGVANSDTATVSIMVNPLPVAANGSYVTDQGLPLSVAAPGALSGATGGGPLTAILVTSPAHGTLALESDGSFVYTPATGYTGTDSFTYQANDGLVNSNAATVSITVNPLPVAINHGYVTDQGLALSVAAPGVLLGDTAGSPLTVLLVAGPAHGTLSLNADGSFLYTPAAGYAGPDSFSYQANDGLVNSNAATVSITVNPLPAAANQSYVTDQGLPLSLAAPGVLLGATGGGPLTAVLVTGPGHGTLALQSDGSFLYTPAAGYTGPDSFSYQANDGLVNSNAATVSITVNPLPVATNESYVTDQGVALSVAGPGVLANDTGGSPLTAVLVGIRLHGTLTFRSDGSFLYTPAAGYTGTDSFTYQANDGVTNSNTATVSITVNPLPVTVNGSYVTDQGVALSVAAPGVLVDATAGSALTAVLVTSPVHGTLALESNGSFLYTPAAGYSGPDSFSYQASDGVTNSNTAVVSITVNPLPAAANGSYVTDQGVALSVAAPGVLLGATAGGPLTAVLVTSPVHGTLALESNGSFLYTPTAGYSGTDGFTYQANDGVANSNTATVSITVDPLPVATNESYVTDQGMVLSVAAPGVLVDATAGSPLTAVLVTGPVHGTLALESDGSFLYTPAAGYTGPDSFSYQANDGLANSNAATVSITVSPLPVAANQSYVTDSGLPLSVAAPGVLCDATAGSPLTAVLVTGPVHGTLALESDGAFLYTPAAGYAGPDSFSYQANDGLVNSNAATVSVTVNPLPAAANESYVTDQGVALSVAAPGVLVNATAGSPLTAVLVTGPGHGTLSLNPDGSFLYTPAAGYTGPDSFSYQANDGLANSNIATVSIAVNSLPAAVNETYVTDSGQALSVAAPGVLGTGFDPQGYPLAAVLVTGPAYGSVVLSPDGSFLYTPTAGYNGTDSFTYQANDGVTSSNPATVSITVVGLHTMAWQGSGSGNWTDAGQWTGSPPAYPDITANVVLNAPDSVQVDSAQAANSLQISNGGQVLIATGGSLTVTTDTGVTAGGALNVDANGAFSTGGTLTLDTGGSVSGGSVNAAAFQLNDGTAGANLCGPGGLTKDTSGTVTLSGTNVYSGGTTVSDGLLVISNSSAIPSGSMLSIGPDGSLVLGGGGVEPLGTAGTGAPMRNDAVALVAAAAPAASSGTVAPAQGSTVAAGAPAPGSGTVASSPVSAVVQGAPSTLARVFQRQFKTAGSRLVSAASGSPAAATGAVPTVADAAKASDAVFRQANLPSGTGAAASLPAHPFGLSDSLLERLAWVPTVEEMTGSNDSSKKKATARDDAVDQVLSRYWE
jgi:autotransporter-associated beta strand protein